MPTRNINLTERLDEFVEESVSSGRYSNASEVIRDGLRLLAHKAEEEAIKLKNLQKATAAGFDAIAMGRYRDLDAKSLRGHIAAIGRRASAKARKAG